MKTFFRLVVCALVLLSCEKNSDNVPQEPANLNLTKSTSEIIEADNEFGFSIFRQVLENDTESRNIFISPTSIALALAMTYNGAEGETRSAMEITLLKQGFTNEEINLGYKSLIGALKSVDSKILLEIANSIWYDNDFSVLPDFVTINQQYYQAEVNSLDFSDPEAPDIINGWVDNKTHGKIGKVIDGIGGDVVMYLINAIYFKGMWKYEFDKSNTESGSFQTNKANSVPADFMKQSATLSVMINDTFAMAELPYGRGNFSMMVLLPNQGFSTDDITGSLTVENWNHWISVLQERNVDLTLPRFKFEYNNLLNDELSDMGMGVAFSDMADFSGINGTGGIKISRVIHKAFVEVNEEGTEAAAVTAVEVVFLSLEDDHNPIFSFIVNRPFLFAIRETTTGAILFMGRVNEVGSLE